MKRVHIHGLVFFTVLFFQSFFLTSNLFAAGHIESSGYAMLVWDYDYTYTRPAGPSDTLHIRLSESYNLKIKYIKDNGQLQVVTFTGPEHTLPDNSDHVDYTQEIVQVSGTFYQGDPDNGYVKIAELKMGDAGAIYDPTFGIASSRVSDTSVDTMLITSSHLFFPKYDEVLPWRYEPLFFRISDVLPGIVPLNIQELDRCLDPALTCTNLFITSSTDVDDTGYSTTENTKLQLTIVAGSLIDLPPLPAQSKYPQAGIINLLLHHKDAPVK